MPSLAARTEWSRAPAGRPAVRAARLGNSACHPDRDEAHRRLILALAAVWSGLSVEALSDGARGDARLARARHLACYLGHVGLGLSRARVALLVGRDRTSVSYACARIEAERDEPSFDRDVSRLEAAAQFAACRGEGA